MGTKQLLMDLSKPINLPLTRIILRKHYRSSKSPADLKNVQRVLVLAPHMDDETIGLGGTIRKHADAGAEVHCAFVTDGSGSVSSLDKKTLTEARRAEISKVKDILGISAIHYMDLPDGGVQSHPDSQRKLLELLHSVRPELIYCPPFVDCHPDHTATAEILSDTLKQWDVENCTVRLYEVNCPIPPEEINCVIDITDEFAAKKRAIEVFKSQAIAFDGFLELNRMKAQLVRDQAVESAEGFIEVPANQYVEQFDRLAAHHHPYPRLFKQANRTDTLLWAVLQNYGRKKDIYKQRL
ncbi:MAG TPA: PIG-L family deacetylase [Bacillales bacterium]|nr:PIG-L family deacetylase [Bacillales bacterium]